MRTPAGKECKYFFGDYYRGRSHEECRLLNSASPPINWKPEYCSTCPLPGILLANACPFIEYVPDLKRKFPFGKQVVHVNAICSSSGLRGFDPYIGCGNCHPLPLQFKEKTG